jgi:putative sigma-54 modulation protein
MLIREQKNKEVIMEIRIQAIHFDAAERLETFIRKKVSKLEQFHDGILAAEVVLRVIKPETANNKQVRIKLTIKNNDCFAEKANNTFEEAIDAAVIALGKQLVKIKKKTRTKNGTINDVAAVLEKQLVKNEKKVIDD